MKIKAILLLFLLNNPLISFSQFIVVKDSLSNPIPYVKLLSKDTGVYANHLGEIKLSHRLGEDFVISHTNFEEYYYQFTGNEIDTIVLKSKPILLKEVFISNKKKIKSTKFPTQPNSLSNFPLSVNNEILIKLSSPNSLKNTILKKISFKLNNADKINTAIVVLNVYDSEFKNRYTSKPVSVNFPRKSLLEFKLENEIVDVKGLFIGLEVIEINKSVNDTNKFTPFIGIALTKQKLKNFETVSLLNFPLNKSKTKTPLKNILNNLVNERMSRRDIAFSIDYFEE